MGRTQNGMLPPAGDPWPKDAGGYGATAPFAPTLVRYLASRTPRRFAWTASHVHAPAAMTNRASGGPRGRGRIRSCVFTALRTRPEHDATSAWQYHRHARKGTKRIVRASAYDQHERSRRVAGVRHTPTTPRYPSGPSTRYPVASCRSRSTVALTVGVGERPLDSRNESIPSRMPRPSPAAMGPPAHLHQFDRPFETLGGPCPADGRPPIAATRLSREPAVTTST